MDGIWFLRIYGFQNMCSYLIHFWFVKNIMWANLLVHRTIWRCSINANQEDKRHWIHAICSNDYRIDFIGSEKWYLNSAIFTLRVWQRQLSVLQSQASQFTYELWKLCVVIWNQTDWDVLRNDFRCYYFEEKIECRDNASEKWQIFMERYGRRWLTSFWQNVARLMPSRLQSHSSMVQTFARNLPTILSELSNIWAN